MKSVLITGATGFIGRQALNFLIKKDFIVHALFSTNKPQIEYPNVIWHQVNLHDKESVENVLQSIHASHLLHLAWITKPEEYWTSPVNLDWLNASVSLLNTFIKYQGKRAVLAGTCAEYDWQYGYCREYITPCNPSTLYGKTKHSLYLHSEMLAKQHSISFAWGRLFYVFGNHEHPQRLIPSAICHLSSKKEFNIANKRHIRDYIYVTDAAEALVALLDSDVSGPVNIGSGKPTMIEDLIALIAEKTKGSHLVKYQNADKLTNPLVTADVTRLFNEVKWQPKYSLSSALDETIQWWSKQI